MNYNKRIPVAVKANATDLEVIYMKSSGVFDHE